MQRRHVFHAATLALALSLSVGALPLARAADRVVRLGTMSGPDAQIWEVVREVAGARVST